MGIAGSIVNQDLFEDYFGMRIESVDMTELIRRIERKIYDPEEFKRALAWVKKNCREGRDCNKVSRTRKRKDWEWGFVVKSALIGPRPDDRATRVSPCLASAKKPWATTRFFPAFRPAPLDRSLSER